MENETKFNLPNWKKITDKTAALLYSEGEKRLEETVVTFNIFTDKAFRLLSLMLPSVTLVAGFVVYSNPIQQSGANWPAIVFVFSNIPPLILLIRTVSGYTIHTNGSLPRDLFLEDSIKDDIKGSQYIGTVVTLSEIIQDKINHNILINLRRAKLVKYALWCSGVVAPVFAFIVFLSFR